MTKSPNDKCSLEIAEKYDYIPQPDEWTINIHDGQEESFYATAYKPIIETIGFIPHKDATNYKYVKKVKGGILATVNSKGELQANKITHDCDWLERFESNLYGSNYTCF